MIDDMKEVLTKKVTKKNILDTACKLKQKDINITDIMDVTGSSREVIESL